MTKYTNRLREHWEKYAPNRMKMLLDLGPETETFFSEIGAQIQEEVSSLTEDITAVLLAEMPEAREDYLRTVATMTTARKIAEEIAMTHQLAWVKDPALTLSEAREEWELDRPMDESLVDVAVRVQNSDYPIFSTEEMEEMAKEWAVPLDFLNQMFESENPCRFMYDHQAVMDEAATIRFLREVG